MEFFFNPAAPQNYQNFQDVRVHGQFRNTVSNVENNQNFDRVVVDGDFHNDVKSTRTGVIRK